MKIKLFDSEADDAKCILTMNDPNDAINYDTIIEHNGMHYAYFDSDGSSQSFARRSVFKLPKGDDGEVEIGG